MGPFLGPKRGPAGMSTDEPGAGRPRRRVNFEVSVRRQRRWEVFGTYSAPEREMALADAKKIEKDGADGTKVTKETFHLDTNRVETAVIYRSPALEKEMIEIAADRPEPKRARPAPVPATAQARPAKPAPASASAAPKKQQKVVEDVSMIRAVPWIMAALLVSTLIGGALTVATSYGLQYAVGNGLDLTRQTQIGILSGVFLIVTGSVLFSQLRRIIRRFTATTVTDVASRPLADPSASNTAEDAASGTDTSSEGDEPSEVSGSPAGQASVQPLPTTGPLGEAAAKATEFDVTVARSITSQFTNLDAGQRFAVNVYLGGAMDRLAGDHDLGRDAFQQLFTASLGRLGAPAEIASRLPDLLEGYLGQPRVRDMYETGAAHMDAFLSGGAEVDPAAALADWDEPAEKVSADDEVIAVMFTEIVDPTEQDLSEKAAEAVQRIHNRIVRRAVDKAKGKEVKQTGDGIMASFAAPAAAVAAALRIQDAVAEHGDKHPDQRFEVRIGIDAGTVVHEDGDLFGPTVQLASRLCDSGAAGEILTSRILRDLCGGKHEFRQLEDISLKGFPEPVAVCRVVSDNGLPKGDRRVASAG